MLYLILITMALTYVWFLYTQRKETLRLTKYVLSFSWLFTKTTLRTIKLEANKAKLRNELEELTDTSTVEAHRDARKDVKALLEEVGIDREYYVETTKEIEAIKQRIAEAKAAKEA